VHIVHFIYINYENIGNDGVLSVTKYVTKFIKTVLNLVTTKK